MESRSLIWVVAGTLLLCLSIGVVSAGTCPSPTVVLDINPLTIGASHTYDVDTNTIGPMSPPKIADIWWNYDLTPETTWMRPQGSATIVNLGTVDFDTITADQLAGYSYSTNPISGTQLVSGDVFAVHTDLGNYAKLKVLTYGLDISLQEIVYSCACSHPDVCNTNTNIGYGTDIQSAINEATPGNTITVDSGHYTGFTVNKAPLTIKGISYDSGGLPWVESASGSVISISPGTIGTTLEDIIVFCTSPDCTGVLIESTFNVLKNIEVHGGTSGILIHAQSHNQIQGCSAFSNVIGIKLEGDSHDNTIDQCTLAGDSSAGVIIGNGGSSYTNTIKNSDISGMPYGIWLGDDSGVYTTRDNRVEMNKIHDNVNGIGIKGTDNIIRTNEITGNNNNGIIVYATGQNNLIYNNKFQGNTGLNVNPPTPPTDLGNKWNIDKTVGPNIIGGPYLGGNFWAADGITIPGFSESCIDAGGDGICDSQFAIDGRQTPPIDIDYLPLTANAPPTWGYIHVTSDPSGAGIYGGPAQEYIHNTPYTFQVSPVQDVLITVKHAGYYDKQQTIHMIAGETVEASFILDIIPPPAAPTVTSIDPATGVNTGSITVDIVGNGFVEGAAVKLSKTGQTDIAATIVTISADQITCTFDITGAASGAWDVVVTNPDEQFGTLSDGFKVIAAPPTVTGITPGSGVNTGSVTVEIDGTGFTDETTVMLTPVGSTPNHEGFLKDGGGEAPYLNNPSSIYVSGNYAYIADFGNNPSGIGALEIVDVSDPTAPVHAGSITDGGDALLNEPQSVFVSDNYAYVASVGSNALEIVDVSDPTAPVHAGSITDGGGEAPYLQVPTSVFVSGNYAYVVSVGTSALEIVDVSNPAAPVHVGSITDGGGEAPYLQVPESVFVSGNYAYVASTGSSALEIVDVTDPANPVHKGSIKDGGTLPPFLDMPESVYVSGNYAYVASADSNALEIVDVSDPAAPHHEGYIRDGHQALLNSPRGVFVSGNYAYVASYMSKALEIVDVSNPSFPIPAGSVTDGGGDAPYLVYPEAVYVAGTHAYVISEADAATNALEIVDTGTVTGTDVSVSSDKNTITCTFDLNGKNIGPYIVVVTNPDGQFSTLIGGFYVNPSIQTPACGNVLFDAARVGVRGTWTLGLYAGGSVWWEQMDDIHRQMKPSAGTTIVNLGTVDFDAITIGKLMGYDYSTDPINGNDDETNLLVPGDVFAVHTNSGNYAKVQVLNYGYTLTLHVVTYNAPCPALSVTKITPNTGSNMKPPATYTIEGTGFVGTPHAPFVSLQPDCDCDSIPGTDVNVESSTTIYCKFDLTGAPPGPADVTVTIPITEESATLEDGFSITGPLTKCAGSFFDVDTTLGWNSELDLDKMVSGTTDILWSINDGGLAEMVPENGARITSVGTDVNFDTLNVDYLAEFSYDLTPIPGEDLVPGYVFAVETNTGNLSKILVKDRDESGLTLHPVTYDVGACRGESFTHAEEAGGTPPGATWYGSDKPADSVADWSGTTCDPGCTAWWFCLDKTPLQNQQHDVTCYASCVDDPEVVTPCELSSPPDGVKMIWLKGEPPKRSGTNEVGGAGGGGGLFSAASDTGSCDPLKINCDRCYALLVSGGYDVDNNNARYYEDISSMYRTLTKPPYCYPESHIYVLMSDGTDPMPDQITDSGAYVNSNPDLDADDQQPEAHYAAATRWNLDDTLALLSGRKQGESGLKSEDHLFVFTTNHGGKDTSTTNNRGVRLWLWNKEFIWADEFTSELPTQTTALVMTMEQCNSGGFVEPFIPSTPPYSGTQQRVIATAASATEPSNLNYFSHYWIEGVKGPANTLPPPGSGDSDKLVEMRETFDFAKAFDLSAQPGTPDNLKETPQYRDGGPSGSGLTLALTSCARCPTPTALSNCLTCKAPRDPDGDGLYEDLNGVNGADGKAFTMDDVILYFNRMESIAAEEPICAFDTNANGRIDFADVVNLYHHEVM